MSIKAKLAILVGVFSVFATVLLGGAVTGICSLSSKIDGLHDRGVLATRSLARAQDGIWKLRFGISQYLAVPDPASRKKIIDETPKWFEAVDKSLDDFKPFATTEETSKALAKLQDWYGQYRQARPQWFELMEAGKIQEAADFRAKTILISGAETVKALDSLIDLQTKRGDALVAEAKAKVSHWLMIIVGIGVLSFLVSTTYAFFIVGSIIGPLDKVLISLNALSQGDLRVQCTIESQDEIGRLAQGVNQASRSLAEMIGEITETSSLLLSSSDHIISVSEQIVSSAGDAAGQIGSVATASEEMAATSGDIARSCAMAADASRHTADSATDGAQVVHGSITGMNTIAERVRQTSVAISSLGTRSDQIGEIIATIEDIADQTNLLALNAAIEAARAGEQGRGFAVVADEVRALAERTTKATREIGDMIMAIQCETRQAVKAMEEGVQEVEKGATSSEKSGVALETILTQINEVTQQINQIATAAEEQTATTMEITSNIQQTTDKIMWSSDCAGKAAEAANQLSVQAHKLEKLVSHFHV